MSAMPDDTTAYYAALVREPCLLAEDLIGIALAEPDAWQRFASTAEHSMGKADWALPFLVVRTHVEQVEDDELVFVLVAMRPEGEDGQGALFGEFACSPTLYAKTVKRFGLERPVPRTADGFEDGTLPPDEHDERAWAELLDDDIPF